MSEQERRDRLEIIADLVAARKHIYDLEAEIKALRGFIYEIENIPCFDKGFLLGLHLLAEKHNIITKTGQPTALLTGERE